MKAENIYENTLFPNHASHARTQNPENVADVLKKSLMGVSVLLFFSLLGNVTLGIFYFTCSGRETSINCTESRTDWEGNPFVANGSFLPLACYGDRGGFSQNQSSMYIFLKEKTTWQASRETCRNLGGDLVVVNSKEEQEYIADMVKVVAESRIHWIGVTDIETEGVWMWVDNKPLMPNESYWHSTPDDWKEENPSGEDCVILYKREWGDNSCLNKYQGICEVAWYK